jgi:hypothetical protein
LRAGVSKILHISGVDGKGFNHEDTKVHEGNLFFLQACGRDLAIEDFLSLSLLYAARK